MAFDSGTRLGAFQILAPLGAGGMGEVYSALDTRLDRQVALKMVRDELVADPEHGLRFEHEARTLASLSHPNIAVLHGFEQVEGRHFLVMELAKGETLADRIARYPGGLPVDDAVKIARQIAEALEAAHEKGIVHRDLKPGNVKVGSDDTVKVLDFGLAKAIGPAAAIAPDGMDSPTVAAPATGVGVLLGTAAYLAPEQARGKAVDRRADIWAFGAVLFEMLSGSRLFKGDTPSDIVAAVLTREPELDRLPPGVPASLHLLLRRCLEHDPRRRLRDIGEARIMLEQPVLQASPAPTADARATGASPLRWVALALAVGAAAALAAWQLRPVPYQPVIQYEIPAPAGASLELSARPAVAVSPDGSMLAMVVSAEGEARLYLRNRGDVELREVPGTSGASDPAFSPDGRWIAFVTPAELVKVSVDGGTRVALAPVQDPRGIAWLDNETIVAALSVETGLSAVPAGGGPLRDLTAPDRGRGERTHRWPAPVPGGGAVLFTVGTVANPDDYNDAPVDAVVVATGERRRVLEAATMARVTADRRLLFSRHGVLHAAGFDPTRLQLTAPPRPVLPAVEGDATTGAGHFSISTEGTLAYVPGRSAIGQRHLAWADRSGALSPINLAPAVFNQPSGETAG